MTGNRSVRCFTKWAGSLKCTFPSVSGWAHAKAGRRCLEFVKEFQPITLISFILTTLERVLDVHLRTIMKGTPLSKVRQIQALYDLTKTD